MKRLALALLSLGLVFADFTIPVDQPICRLYGMIKLFGTVVAVIACAYAGFILIKSQEHAERNMAKGLVAGVFMGIVLIWLAPMIVTNLVGGGSVCGWN